MHHAGYQVSGEIHRKGYQQNSRQCYQQSSINTDSNFPTCDFFEYPYNQPDQSQQDCGTDDYEAAIGHDLFIGLAYIVSQPAWLRKPAAQTEPERLAGELPEDSPLPRACAAFRNTMALGAFMKPIYEIPRRREAPHYLLDSPS